MNNQDPIQRIESMVHDLHDRAGKHTQLVLRRYPLLFAFLLVFSIAAIIHGFDLVMDRYELFDKYPVLLMSAGIVTLVLTGTLYESLKKMK